MEFRCVDILLAQSSNEVLKTFVLPSYKADVGDLLLHDGVLFTVIRRGWMDTTSDAYAVLEGSTTLYVPDKVLSVSWTKDETEDNHGDS